MLPPRFEQSRLPADFSAKTARHGRSTDPVLDNPAGFRPDEHNGREQDRTGVQCPDSRGPGLSASARTGRRGRLEGTPPPPSGSGRLTQRSVVTAKATRRQSRQWTVPRRRRRTLWVHPAQAEAAAVAPCWPRRWSGLTPLPRCEAGARTLTAARDASSDLRLGPSLAVLAHPPPPSPMAGARARARFR